jgi:hypothetical protein
MIKLTKVQMALLRELKNPRMPKAKDNLHLCGQEKSLLYADGTIHGKYSKVPLRALEKAGFIKILYSPSGMDVVKVIK